MLKSKFYKIILTAAVLVSLVFLPSCSKTAGKGTVNGSARMMSAKKMAPAAFAADSMAATEMSVMESNDAVYEESAPDSGAVQERKLIYSGDINLEVSSLAESKQAVEAWVKKFGGYISNSSESSTSVSFTANIPSAEFHNAMNEGGQIGKLKSKNIYSNDVTDNYYDLETRLSTRHILLERLEKYLAEAKDMKEMLQIETKINDITSELERMEGQMNRLKNQIDYSRINVYASLPVNQSETGFILPDTKTGARKFLGNVVNFFANFAFVALYIVVFGVPVILFFMLIYWLTFGKIGLIRKLFRRIR